MSTWHEKQYRLSLHLVHFFLEWEMFQIKIMEKIKAHILCSITFFWGGRGNRAIYEIMWKKYRRVGQATDDIMAHADCMVNT